MDIDLARQHWQDGTRRVERSRGRRRTELLGGVDLVVQQLRKRLGQTFTLSELADHYDGADDWVRDVLDEADPEGPGPAEPGTVTDAAFHVYAHGAADYRP